ncbi:hypothetical protein LWI29_003910 [Acer saccharum]|uniref:Uncharacterized protein n=1 Tax=Acer saccharum TaxID=4024 RepID=A0AA39VXP8_ACESA|nr:hypothetical protein LWI29_003910 [Acer saccharum]
MVLSNVVRREKSEDGGANVGAEQKFDEEESDEEESEPSLFYDETCLSKEVFADLDLPPVFDEEVFDKESMIADLDLPPVFDEEIFDKKSMSADFDPKPELVEEECHAAKVDKEASLGIGDQLAPKFNNIGVVDSGNTAEEHGSAMVVRGIIMSFRVRARAKTEIDVSPLEIGEIKKEEEIGAKEEKESLVQARDRSHGLISFVFILFLILLSC